MNKSEQLRRALAFRYPEKHIPRGDCAALAEEFEISRGHTATLIKNEGYSVVLAARRTQCIRGHELNDANLYSWLNSKGKRQYKCRACCRTGGRAYTRTA